MTYLSAQETKNLRKILYVGDGVYLIEVGAEADEFTWSSLCRVHDDAIRRIEYDSPDFNKEIGRGTIFIKPISHAIGAFHDAVTAQATKF